jgi:hypothetical protein
MRVFYDEIDVLSPPPLNQRFYYVKMDNLAIPHELRGFRVFEAADVSDLISKIRIYYKLNTLPNLDVQLWSNQPFTGKRLDLQEELPAEQEFLWVRVVPKKN